MRQLKKYFISHATICMLMLSLCCMNAQAQSIRKNYREMTATEKQVFVNALIALKSKPQGSSNVIDNYANIHSVQFGAGIHNGERFTAWHRWFLHQFEIELRNSGVAGASKINLPYWDWTSQYFTAIPTDQSTSAPLWDNSFLGGFNAGWNLNRNLGMSGSLPTITSINNVLAITSYPSFRFDLEGNNHNGPHPWVGGIMGGALSPADPIFYLHHNMVDLIWAKWHNLGRITSFINNTLPAYPGISATSIIDPRSTKIWYTENGNVTLDKYTVSNNILGTFTGAENYRYTGTINVGGSATNFFTTPSGQTCNMISSTTIALKPGTSIVSGATFSAKIDPNSFNTARKAIMEYAVEEDAKAKQYDWVADVLIYPNPTKEVLNIKSQHDVASVELYSTIGDKVLTTEPLDSKNVLVNIQRFPAGAYTLKVIYTDNRSYTKLIMKQ